MWAQFMFAKYCFRSASVVSRSRRHSPIWRRIFQAGQKIQPFMRWSLGEGKISFWEDTWLEEIPLRELANISLADSNHLVCNFWRGDGWDEEKLGPYLAQRGCPESILWKIVETPFYRSNNDLCRWTLTGNGNFTSASAWQLARNHQPSDDIFKQVWCTALTPSMSIFMWRLVANRIPVDTKIQWRMMQLASKCRCCKASKIETAEHLFIESEAAQQLWTFFGKWFTSTPNARGAGRSITQRMKQWWSDLPGHDHIHISSVLPCLIMWFLWLERNDCTFGDANFNTGHILEDQPATGAHHYRRHFEG